MATATYSVTTSATNLKELWRKVQAGVVVAAQFGVEEWNLLKKLENFDVDWSAREITMELDINKGYGAAAIPEGGKEARPSSPTAVTATVSWILLNKRFTISKTAKFIADKTPKAMLENQLKYQVKKAVEALHSHVGDQFYGFSTGTLCKVDSVSTDDVVLKDLYGVSGLGATTDDRRCVDLFEAGEYVAFLNPSGPALRSDGIVLIDSKTRSTNIITGSAVSDVGSLTAGDLVLRANNLENTTLASGTERNMNLVGLLDMMTTASVHGVSNGSYDSWTPGSDTGGGRFTGIKLRKMKQYIQNNGGGKLDTVLWSNGVENDVVAQLQAGLRFDNAFNMEMDGAAKSRGITFFTSRRVPDGYVFGFDSKKSVCKATLLPEPSEGGMPFEDLDKLQDDSGYVGSIDYPVMMVTKNRGNMYYLSGVTEQ